MSSSTRPTRLGQTSNLKFEFTKPGKVECISDHSQIDNVAEKYIHVTDLKVSRKSDENANK